MKTLKKMVMAMVAICMSISFMACESDDHKTENINLKGRWYSKTETVNNLLIINDDIALSHIKSAIMNHGRALMVILR
jgi:uncharacterized lipoprotein YehR (DUF1307 family)